MPAPSLNIIGAGHVGSALGRVFAASGAFRVQDVLTRSTASARQAVQFIGAGRVVSDVGQLRHADAVMLAVSDDQIVAVCGTLAGAIRLAGTLVFHCSGALPAAVLDVAAQAGALVASAHPIRSFANPEAVAGDFAGTFCGLEGSAEALAMLAPVLAAAGARPLLIDTAAKTVYHAAAVFASNYLTTLLDAALRAYQAAGIPENTARELLQPLVTETVHNVLRLGPAAALSGPVARGDWATVVRQQQALSAWEPATGELYRALVAPTATLAARKLG